MIARAALVNPLIFAQVKNPAFQIPILEMLEKLEPLMHQYTHPKVNVVRFKKIVSWLATGFDDHASFRKQLMLNAHDLSSILKQASSFFGPCAVSKCPQELGFLKGGHG